MSVFDSYEVADSGCWLWTGKKTLDGYGYIDGFARKGAECRVHRIAWIEAFGPIPEGMHVLHRCDVRNCINPAHLWLGTHADNMADKRSKGRCKGNPKGCTHPKLDWSTVLAIRASDKSARVLAREHGVGRTTIRDIKDRKTWQNEPEQGAVSDERLPQT